MFRCRKKIIKCIGSIIDYKLQVPYSANMVVYDYDGLEMSSYTKPISGNLEASNTGNIIIKLKSGNFVFVLVQITYR